jgi:hypothetical protein
MSEIDLSQLKSAQKNLWLVSIGSCGGFARAPMMFSAPLPSTSAGADLLEQGMTPQQIDILNIGRKKRK